MKPSVRLASHQEASNVLARIEFADKEKCWGWLGAASGARPYFNDEPATRAVWALFGQEAPGEYELHHECHNPACVNPWHLRPMLREEHLRNHALDRRDRTTCANGHPWTPENTGFRRRGKRVPHRDCRECARGRMRAKRTLI